MDDFISILVNIFIVVGIINFIAKKFKKKGDTENTNEESAKSTSGFNFNDFEKFAAQISNSADIKKEEAKRAEYINNQAEDKFPTKVNTPKPKAEMSSMRVEREGVKPNIHTIAQPNISNYELDVKNPNHEGYASPQYSNEGYASKTEGTESVYEGQAVSTEGYTSAYDTKNVRTKNKYDGNTERIKVLPEFTSQSLVQAFVMSEVINKPKFLSGRGR